MLKEMVEDYGVNKLAYELNLCELSIKNKISGKAKITPSELIAIGCLLNISEEDMTKIRKELNDAQSKDSRINL